MPNICYLDTETFSETPIGNGTYAYAQDAECMVVTWAVNDGPVSCWDRTRTAQFPQDLLDELLDESTIIICHNVMFDRNILRNDLGCEVPIHRFRCSMVKAMSIGLPGSLDKLCEILKIDSDLAKHKTGRQLIHLFCKPMPKNSKLRRATRLTHPEKWAEFLEYAKADIPAMRAVYKKLPEWNYKGAELALWHLDQKINDRGAAVDLELAHAALEAVDAEQVILKASTMESTDGYVESATQRDALLEYILMDYGVGLPDMKKSTLERRIADPELPEGLRALLEIRLQACTTSTSKYKSLIKGTTNGRLCGTIQFDGASRTRRAAGRTFQPQNLPSRGLLPAEEIDLGIEDLKAGNASMLWPNVMKLTSSAIRGCIVAPPGKKLVVADLSNIEGRMLAWMAGEEWKLQAFRDFDNGEGHDLYKLAYAKAFRVNPESVDKKQRSVGKVMELFLGYAGGVGAFLTGALGYGFDLEELADIAFDSIPEETIGEAKGFYEWSLKKKMSTYGLSEKAFVVCDSFKRLWREAHPATVKLWRALEDGCRAAISNPGETFIAGKFKIRRDGAWLRVLMPSGRYMCYPSPEVDEKGALSYMGINQYTRQWQRIKTYSGKLTENICQSLSRDILYDSMPHAEEAGYEIVLHVHDELICEVPDSDEFSAEHLSSLMAANPPWAEGLPLAAEGFTAKRYRKG